MKVEGQESEIIIALRIYSDHEQADLTQENAEEMADHVNERLRELLDHEVGSDAASHMMSEIYGVCVFFNRGLIN